jgi:hypothetical protein
MASSLTPQKSRAQLFTCQTVNSNTAVKGPALDVSGKWAGTVKIRMARTSTSSIGAVEFRVQGGGRGHAGDSDYWVPIYAWTSALHVNAASQANVASTPAANASALDGTWTGITAADGLVVVYDTNTAARTEWARVLSVTGSVLTFQDTLTRVHTVTSNKVVDQAEEWSIPIDLTGEETLRLTVDCAKNAVTVPVVVEGVIVYHDATVVNT